jgi:hypothetical protein
MSAQNDTAPVPGAPTITIRAIYSRAVDGVRLFVDRERGFARVDLGARKSYDLVGLVRKIADAVVGCTDVEIVGDDRRALDYVREQLPKEVRHVDGWLASGLDNRGAA